MHILLTSLLEGKFKNRKNQILIADVPMFSIFIGDEVSAKDAYNIKRSGKRIKSVFEKARQQIHSMGFSSMHANVLIKDLSNHPNQNTGTVGVAGLAYRKGKYIEIDSSQFSSAKTDYLVKIIVHEWAHLWMFNNSKEFKQSVDALYKKLIASGAEKMQHKDVESVADKLDYELEMALISSWSTGLYRMVHDIYYEPSMTGERLKDYIETQVVRCFEYICREYQFAPSAELIKKVSSMAEKYIFPKVNEMAKNKHGLYITYLAGGHKGMDKLYTDLWVDNNLRPSDVSIMGLFRQMNSDRELRNKKAYMSSNDATFIGKDYEFHRKYLKNIHNWVSDYGMSNNDEMWATGIEEFFKLPLPHRKAIIKLMMNMGAK